MRTFLALLLAMASVLFTAPAAQAYDDCPYPQDRAIVFSNPYLGIYQRSGSAVSYGWVSGSAHYNRLTLTTVPNRRIHHVWAYGTTGASPYYSGAINVSRYDKVYLYNTGGAASIKLIKACVGPNRLM